MMEGKGKYLLSRLKQEGRSAEVVSDFVGLYVRAFDITDDGS
jgi:hypothetical protein